MRIVVIAVAAVLLSAGSVLAQEWTEFQSIEDGFRVSFPGQPKVSETTWTTQFDYTIPARVYTADKGKEHYALTVVDYRALEPLGVARRKACPAGAEPCIGSEIGRAHV